MNQLHVTTRGAGHQPTPAPPRRAPAPAAGDGPAPARRLSLVVQLNPWPGMTYQAPAGPQTRSTTPQTK
jgi:hypothetical protein